MICSKLWIENKKGYYLFTELDMKKTGEWKYDELIKTCSQLWLVHIRSWYFKWWEKTFDLSASWTDLLSVSRNILAQTK